MKNLKTIYLFLFIVLASCLPQEKTTECGSNEAYNSTSRKCVAVLGASSASVNISNITPATSYAVSKSDSARSHAVTISDPNGYGFQVKWMLVLPNGGSTLLGTGLSITFNHSTFSEGSYTVEVQLLNAAGTEVFDSRSWTVRVIGEEVPTVSRLTGSPFTTTTTSATTTINATANNPDAISNINYQWYANGTAVAGESGTFSTTAQALPFVFDPTSASTYHAGAGVYSVQVILTEDISGAIYSSESWTINNNIPNVSSISLGTSTTHATTTPNSGSIITVINDTTINSRGFLYDVDGNTTLDAIDFCVKTDDIKGVDGKGIFVDFIIDNGNIPSATDRQLTAVNTSVCLETFNNFKYTIPANIVNESHTIKAVVYDKYTGSSNLPSHNGYTQIDSFSWTVRVRQKNTPPIIIIDEDNTTNGISCSGKTSTTYSNCAITQNDSFDVAVTVTDDDYDPAVDFDKFRVQFYIDGSLMDGTDVGVHALPTHSNCYHDFSQNLSSNRYICSVTINPYDKDGPINIAGAGYTLKAKITDADSPYLVSATDSNEVSWIINSVAGPPTNSVTVNQFATDEADHVAHPYNAANPDDLVAAYSYISTQAVPGTAITLNSGAVTEGEIIQFHTFVSDPERDTHTIKIERCIASDCNALSGYHVPAIVTSTTNSVTGFAQKQTTLNHQVAEDEVIGAASATVGYRVTVTDSKGATSETKTNILINNYNPAPVFSTGNFNPTVPSSLIAFTGFPLTIDPGSVTDASTADGDTILYQWLYSTDAGTNWKTIGGANQKILAWSPGQELDFSNQTGQAIKIKLCIGDDGYDSLPLNGASNECRNVAADTSGNVDAAAWDVTVYSNMVSGKTYLDNATNNTSSGELAVWVDPSSVDPVVKYMAYVSKNKEIIVEKIVTSSTGAKNGSTEKTTEELTSIKFSASTATDFATQPVTNLSITGDSVNNSLYISYMAPITGVNQVHIRRIDISGGKTGFVHDGKFGFDPGYDDLTNNIIVTSAGISNEIINGSGLAEITFTNSASALAMAINFNGIHGGSTDLIGGNHFCNPTSVCTTINSTATNFAAAINASTATELQGLTASAVGGVVTLSGAAEDEFLQADIGATKIGSIVINQTSGKWVLPIIDHDLSGGDQNKIALLQGNLNIRLSQSGMVKTTLLNSSPSQDLANDIDGNDVIIIAIKEYITGNTEVYELDAILNQIDTQGDLFGVPSIKNLKVTVSKETSEFDPSAFITGTNSNGRLALARIDSTAGNYSLNSATMREDLDSGFELLFDLDNYDITAGPEEYQLLIGIVSDYDYTAATDGIYEAYLLSVTGNSPTVDCSYDSANPQDPRYCMKLFTSTSDTIFDMEVALGDVLEDVTIGTAGSVANENKNDIIPYAFHKDDGGGNILNDALPILGLINVTGITLTGDETTPGSGYVIPYVAP